MHDTTLLQLIEDDIAPMQELLDLLHKQSPCMAATCRCWSKSWRAISR